MRTKRPLLITAILLSSCTAVFSQGQSIIPEADGPPPIEHLHNSDVLRMVEKGQKAGQIITTILTSYCNFDVFPPVIRDLKRRGVPDTVLMAMRMAPNGPPAMRSAELAIKSVTIPVRIPAGTPVEVEASYPISSAKAKKGDLLTFQVTRQVFVNGVLIIDRGAVAKARIVSTRPAGSWGRAGMLAWAMEYVVAVDGTRLPLAVSGRIKGGNRSVVVAGGALATASLIFPYTSPVALVWGLKKGDEAILRGSKPFAAVVSTEREVGGVVRQRDRLFLHDIDTVKASIATPAQTPLERLSIRH